MPPQCHADTSDERRRGISQNAKCPEIFSVWKSPGSPAAYPKPARLRVTDRKAETRIPSRRHQRNDRLRIEGRASPLQD